MATCDRKCFDGIPDLYYECIFCWSNLWSPVQFNYERQALSIYLYQWCCSARWKANLYTQRGPRSKRIESAIFFSARCFRICQKRVPDLTTTLKKYQLKNPLPSTLYIMYNDQEQFTSMKTLLEKNKNLILNMNDLSENAIKTQEKRVLNIINLSNFMQSFGYLVVLVMLAAVIWFAIFFLNAIFSHFKRDIQAKKLLGATAHQIAQPFLQVIFKTLLFAFIIAALLLVATTLPLEHYLQVLFSFSLLNHISTVIFELLATGIMEIWMIMLILMAVSYCYVLRLHKQLK